MRRNHTIAAAAIVVASVGCSDRTTPGEAAFRPALEAAAAQAFCRRLYSERLEVRGAGPDGGAWPLVVAAGVPFRGMDRAERSDLEGLVRDGLAMRGVARRDVRAAGSSGDYRTEAVVTYASTEAGRRYLGESTARTMDGRRVPVPAVCDAAGEVTRVVRWTAPMDVMGRRISRVTYAFRGVDPRPGLSPEAAARLGEREKTVTLELASDGWVAAR